MRQIILLICVSTTVCLLAIAQKSPGRLSTVHSAFDEAGSCTTCHRQEDGGGGFQCLDCHDEIGDRVKAKKGLHASFLDPTTGSDDCVACHAEHKGLEAELIQWDGPIHDFDHTQTGFTLEGRHEKVSCRKCHSAKNIPAENGNSLAARDLERTFLGLSTDCQACHAVRSPHGQRFAAEPHVNRCQECHTPKGFAPSTFTIARHQKTRFPLEGAHGAVVCSDCHVKEPSASGKPAGRRFHFGSLSCGSCHENPHGTLASGGEQVNCEGCHTPRAWKPSLFTRERHVSFALTGAHQQVPCRMCHETTRQVAGRQAMVFRATSRDCAGCHDRATSAEAIGSTRREGGE